MVGYIRHFCITLLIVSCIGCTDLDSKVSTIFNQDQQEKKDIHITLILPLTGPKKDIGKNLIDAALMALSDFKKSNVHVTTIDSNNTENNIIAKLDKIKTDLIIGPVYSNDTKKLIPYAKQKEICMVTFSNDESILSNGCTLLLGVMPEQSVLRIVDFTKNEGYNQIFAILPQDKYGETISKHIQETGVEVIKYYEPGYDLTQTELEEVSNIIKSKTAPGSKIAILIPDNREAEQIANFLSLNNSTGQFKFIGGGLWEDDSIYSNTSLNGSWFSAPPKHLRIKFDEQFKIKYGYKPQKIATLGYDAICLTTTLLENTASNQISINLFTKNEGFKGITSSFKFASNGKNIRNLSIYEIKGGKAYEIEPANDVFNDN